MAEMISPVHACCDAVPGVANHSQTHRKAGPAKRSIRTWHSDATLGESIDQWISEPLPPAWIQRSKQQQRLRLLNGTANATAWDSIHFFDLSTEHNGKYMHYIRDASALVLFSIAANALIITSICSSYSQRKNLHHTAGKVSSDGAAENSARGMANKRLLLRSAIRLQRPQDSGGGSSVSSPSSKRRKKRKKQVSFQDSDSFVERQQGHSSSIFQGCILSRSCQTVTTTEQHEQSRECSTAGFLTEKHFPASVQRDCMGLMSNGASVSANNNQHEVHIVPISELLRMACTDALPAHGMQHYQQLPLSVIGENCGSSVTREDQMMLMASARLDCFFGHVT